MTRSTFLGLQCVVVMPAGAGKTTLSEDTFFLDVDRLYSLEETQTTYARMNKQILQLTVSKEWLPDDVAQEHRSRIQAYNGPAKCLLVHSLEAAQAGGLPIEGVWLPAQDLHSQVIRERSEISRYVATTNRATIENEANIDRVGFRVYQDWDELSQLVGALKAKTDQAEDRVGLVDKNGTLPCQRTDEEYLTFLVASGLGCKFTCGKSDA